MSYTITITYAGLTQDAKTAIAPICGMYVPENSYIETPAYEGTVYDTKTHGMGAIELPAEFASESIPTAKPAAIANFRLAVVGEDNTVTIKTDDYKEAFYYKHLGEQLKTSGFTVEVAEDSADDAQA